MDETNEQEQDAPCADTGMSATYDPTDNKLRLYSVARLDAETFARVKAAGFRWAPRQQVFVAPMWTPDREDLLIALCGEIGDENTSLVARAEERAERFEEYSGKRLKDAEREREAAERLSSGIPLGQPILVGHHSEKRARKDAQRIQRGFEKSVQMWKTAGYWKARAAGALAHAEYKEDPGVRHRRIKGLQSDLRRQEKAVKDAQATLALYEGAAPKTREAQLAVANYNSIRLYPENDTAWGVLERGTMTYDEVLVRVRRSVNGTIAWAQRWIEHYTFRIQYEQDMLQEQTGVASLGDRFPIEVGGRVLVEDVWLVVLRVTRLDGKITSVTTTAPRGVTWQSQWKYGIEKVSDYRPPTADETATVKAATKLPPICNYPGEGIVEMTEAEYKAVKQRRWSDFPYIKVKPATETQGAHRIRQRPGKPDWFKAVQVFLTDVKRVDPPAVAERPKLPASIPDEGKIQERADRRAARLAQPADAVDAKAAEYKALEQHIKGGIAPVQVVSAPQFYPTPVQLGHAMAEALDIQPRQRILEPSAGSGRLIDAVQYAYADQESEKDYHKIAEAAQWAPVVTAVEISSALVGNLTAKYRPEAVTVQHADFLTWEAPHLFDRIIMNPPFERGSDIQHIERAAKMLAPGGRLVALCAAGPRQEKAMEALGATWETLEPGAFKSEGTNVNVAMIVYDRGWTGEDVGLAPEPATVTVPPAPRRALPIDTEE